MVFAFGWYGEGWGKNGGKISQKGAELYKKKNRTKVSFCTFFDLKFFAERAQKGDLCTFAVKVREGQC